MSTAHFEKRIKSEIREELVGIFSDWFERQMKNMPDELRRLHKRVATLEAEIRQLTMSGTMDPRG